ncbi:MAG: chloride channel protein [Clostridia bacterium]|nr:chloride channel protein [Clostridia bacterium]
MKKFSSYKNFFLNLIFPALIFGSITGILTSIIVTLYKLIAKYIIEWSTLGYTYVSNHLYLLPIAIIASFGIAFLFAYIYKKLPNIRGGGIPTSIGILRGIITFKWLRTLIGTFLMSLTSFLIGVPLGNEGPAVQIGTAIGRGSVFALAKKHKAWDRYSMTGGACAGFSVATGAPVSGIMFAIEEAHQRISPMIIIVASVSVMFSRITSELIAPIFGVSINLFPKLVLPSLQVKNIWLPLVIGIIVGLFAVLFLYYYRAIYTLFNKLLKKIPHAYKIFVVFALTLIFGVISLEYISTGHHLIEKLLTDNKIAIYSLILILLVRSTLTLFASSNSVTGGLFLPIMALGAVLSSILAKSLIFLGLDSSYYTIILVLGITACISSMMKTPLTAILFAVEALSCYENIIYVVIVSAVAFVITEMFRAESINDSVIEHRIHEINGVRKSKTVDTFVTIKKNAFAVGKQIRDIFWPSNLLVLAVKKDEKRENEVDQYGGKALLDGDTLHIRYITYDEKQTLDELYAIVGEQEKKC